MRIARRRGDAEASGPSDFNERNLNLRAVKNRRRHNRHLNQSNASTVRYKVTRRGVDDACRATKRLLTYLRSSVDLWAPFRGKGRRVVVAALKRRTLNANYYANGAA